MDDSDETVTLSKAEFQRLQKADRTANQIQNVKSILLWACIVVFVSMLAITIKTTIHERKISGIQSDAYYGAELQRAKLDMQGNPQKRPGRLYHRGGRYGN